MQVRLGLIWGVSAICGLCSEQSLYKVAADHILNTVKSLEKETHSLSPTAGQVGHLYYDQEPHQCSGGRLCLQHIYIDRPVSQSEHLQGHSREHATVSITFYSEGKTTLFGHQRALGKLQSPSRTYHLPLFLLCKE